MRCVADDPRLVMTRAAADHRLHPQSLKGVPPGRDGDRGAGRYRVAA